MAAVTLGPTPASALLVEESWIRQILSGAKTWELRGCRTAKRERIALAYKGFLLGEVDIVDCLAVGRVDAGGQLLAVEGHEQHHLLLPQNMTKHNVSRERLASFRWRRWYAWVLSDPVSYEVPKAYRHPTGAQQFVRLDRDKTLSAESSETAAASPACKKRKRSPH
ncbi:PIF1 [Symbiodinium sp. CCMP2592]|nr:PIF1 [Symbiodinium sp. CCMP2592]